jgi:peptidoglycan/xylan/chitin deacetylase (PgdA/CDA1 family)
MSIPRKAVRYARSIAARAALGLGMEGRGLLSLCFHQLIPDQSGIAAAAFDPFQPMCVGDFEEIIVTLKASGYAFVTSAGAARPEPGRRLAWLTFDDGYANNLLALPVLRAHGASATIFISSGAVETGRAYWWDALYRERTRQGQSYAAIAHEREAMKSVPIEVIEDRLERAFGARAFEPAGDGDRPMTVAEVSELAREPLIEIGNHTHRHAILTLHDDERMRLEIATCQDRIATWTGRAPAAIAYPNGDADERVAAAARDCGLTVGVTGPAPLIAPRNPMLIRRALSLRHGRITRELALARHQLAA